MFILESHKKVYEIYTDAPKGEEVVENVLIHSNIQRIV